MSEVVSETWADVKGYEGRYRVSSAGQVMSRSRRTHGLWAVMKPLPTGEGYLGVNLYTSSTNRQRLYIHRLVATAFHGDPGPGCEVDHINGNRQDNRAENLEWVVPGENNLRARLRCGLGCGEMSTNVKASEERVRVGAALVGAGYTPCSVSRALGMSDAWFSVIMRGKAWSHIGLDLPELHRRFAAHGPRRYA